MSDGIATSSGSDDIATSSCNQQLQPAVAVHSPERFRNYLYIRVLVREISLNLLDRLIDCLQYT
jgi:hypothetical protein